MAHVSEAVEGRCRLGRRNFLPLKRVLNCQILIARQASQAFHLMVVETLLSVAIKCFSKNLYPAWYGRPLSCTIITTLSNGICVKGLVKAQSEQGL